jgi:hypothetical protein
MELLKSEDTAARLGVSAGTLAIWRCTKRYPLKFVRVGRNIRYRIEDIEDFIRARTMPGDSSVAPRRSQRSRSTRPRLRSA